MRIKLFLFFFSIIALLIIAVIGITTTTAGLKFILHALPGKTTTEEVSGSLLNGWSIKKLDYKKDQFHLVVDNIDFSWQAVGLLKQNLVINNFVVKNASIYLPPASSEATETNSSLISINLPINIYLQRINLINITIHDNKKEYLINEAQLSANLVNNRLDLKMLRVRTPIFSTSNYGSIDIRSWTNINFNNQLTFYSYPNIPVITTIQGNQHNISLRIKSQNWLNVKFALQHYLEKPEKMTLQSTWLINATKSSFKELSELNGGLQFSGKANGYLLKPMIQGKLLAKDLTYDKYSIKNLNSTLNLSSDNSQKINFSLAGNDICLGETVINSINFDVLGAIKSHSMALHLQLLDNYHIDFSGQGNLPNNKSYLIKNARLNAEPLNLIFSPVNIAIDFNKKDLVSYELHLQHEQEKLSLHGSSELNSADPKTTIQLSSQKITLIDTNAYKIIAAPDLHLEQTSTKTNITGLLKIISAHIAPVDFSNTTTLSSDIVYVNRNNQPIHKKDDPLQLFMNIMMKLEKLSINYKGIRAQITGETKINKTPTTELSAHGQLKFLKGSYKAYGQALTIQSGSSVSFIQQIDNPQLNITASKKIKVSPEYMTLPSYQPFLIAGVQVTGTANQPMIHLFSTPAGVSQQDILSYLIFGFPQKQLTNSQAALLWQALSMMSAGQNGSSLSSLQRSIQKSFGFSEFGLGNTSEYNAATGQYETGTAFVVGKRITDKLTATYNVGLLVPINVLYLRYQLSTHWTLQSDSSVLGNGGDIFYTIQRG